MKSDVVVIGGGPGGYASAIYLGNMGKKVILIEKQDLGGTCLNRGCIPTKAFVQAAHSYKETHYMDKYGIKIDGCITVDFSQTAAFKKGIVEQLKSGVDYLLKSAGVEVVYGTGSLIDKNNVEVTCNDGQKKILNTDYIVLATGSIEVVLKGLEPNGTTVLNSTQMLDLQELPESTVIIGGGVIGVEFASILNDFGKKVTIVELSDRLLPPEEEVISNDLRKRLKRKGVTIYTKAKANRIISTSEDLITIEIEKEEKILELTANKLLVCVGRKANLSGIGLENAGVKTNGKWIETNKYMQTNVENIYAVGDITMSPQLAHLAYHEALVASKNIHGQKIEIDYHAIPGCVFSSPEVARVGMTEAKAREEYSNVKTMVQKFDSNGKAMVENSNDGYIKLVYNGDDGKMLGCSIIGPKATELIAEPSLAVTLNLSVKELAMNINAHPSLSEIIGEAAAAAIGENLHSVASLD